MSNPRTDPWTAEHARRWYDGQPMLIGCNFTPSTASNQIEFWRAESFDPETIDRELGWAADIGMNATRTYLHDAVWRADAAGLTDRIRRYLDIAERHGIATMFCIFDDCWHDDIDVTANYDPIPGVHNSRWLQSPGQRIVNDPTQWAPLEDYVKHLLTTFGDDPRVNIWDLYNEPGNGSVAFDGGTNKPRLEHSLPLLKATFAWARQVNPSQPLTAGVWAYRDDFAAMNRFQLAESDITTFHSYGPVDELHQRIEYCRQHNDGRPLLCTEWLNRGGGNRFQSHLPIFTAQRIGCYNWGLVGGRTQTYQPWGSKPGAAEADPWHHDILRTDGTPFDAQEVEVLQRARAAAG